MLQVAVYRSTCSISIWNMRLPTPYQLVRICFLQIYHSTNNTTQWTLLKSGALIMEAGKRITKPLSSKKKITFHHFSPEMQPQKKIKKSKTAVFKKNLLKSLCVFFDVFCADCSQLEKTRQPRAIPASHGLLKMRKASRPFGLDIENDKVNQPRKPVGRGGWFTRSLRRLEMSMFFLANTQVMTILSLKSLMFFFSTYRASCFRAILNLFQMLQ